VLAAATAFVTAEFAENSSARAERATTLDPQLQAVVEQHKALGPKPIDKLSPAEARKQPSVADAVKALLQKQGKNSAQEPVGNVQYRTVPGAAGPLPVCTHPKEAVRSR
jgi:hypothetical protein